jgi:hypothetical protein
VSPRANQQAAVLLLVLTATGLASGQTVSPPPVSAQGSVVPPNQAGIASAAPGSNDESDSCPSGACWDAATGPAPRWWVQTDALLWWMKGVDLPALVTTSPAGTPAAKAGVFGAPGTNGLFGNSTVDGGMRGGWMIDGGYWLDDQGLWGVETNLFFLSSTSAHFNASSSGDPILARPYVDALTNAPAAQVIAAPGLPGSVGASAVSCGLVGAGALLYRNLCCAGGFRLDVLAGYRFLRLQDRLDVDATLDGTTATVADSFRSRNVFNGFDTGLCGEYQWGCWVVEWLAKVAVGANYRLANVDGSTTLSVPGAPALTSPGGLLALPSNIGQVSDQRLAVIPQFGLKCAYQLTPRLRASAGYTFLLWPDVIRTNNLLDPVVNPTQVPLSGVLPSGPLRPAPTESSSTFWAQGITLGLEFCY